MTGQQLAWSALERCRGCHAPRSEWREVLALAPMPLAGQFCVSQEEARGARALPLTWVQCGRCALVQVLEDVDDEMLYLRYNYSSSTVGGLVRHFERFAAVLAERFAGRGDLRVLEIGCNDGVLLRRLPMRWKKVGVDPSDVAAQAKGPEYELISVPFSSRLARELANSGMKFDLVTASNCLAHISDLRDVFEGIIALLAARGELVVEVHDLDALLHLNQWDTIYHEHKAEWSERSLARCLGSLGFGLRQVERLPLHGGLIRAWFTRETEALNFGPVELEDFRPLCTAYERRRETKAYRALAQAVAAGQTIGAYGASGRANVWLNQHPELKFEYVADDSPLRADHFLPVIGTPVVPGECLQSAATDLCLITAWNYAREIRASNPGYPGRWLTAFGED